MSDYDDTQDYVCSITPQEFELFCVELLKDYAEEEQLKEFTIEHNRIIEAYDGVYQIDIYATYRALGTKMRVLCECKQYKSKVKREIIQILEQKVRSLGMNEGILLSTSGFQKGAIQYAREHGIALMQVFDKECMPAYHSAPPETVLDENNPFVCCEKLWPKYRAVCFLPGIGEQVLIYPTRDMVDKIFAEMDRIMKKWRGKER